MATKDEILNRFNPSQSIAPSMPPPTIETPMTRPMAVPTGFNRLGLTGEIVNPGLETFKKRIDQSIESQNASDIVDHVFQAADKWIPAQKTLQGGTVKKYERGFRRTDLATVLGYGDEGAINWNAVKESFGTILARGFGERGVVTNQDVNRVLKSMPSEGDSMTMREAKHLFIVNLLNKRMERYNQAIQEIRMSINPVRSGTRTGEPQGFATIFAPDEEIGNE